MRVYRVNDGYLLSLGLSSNSEVGFNNLKTHELRMAIYYHSGLGVRGSRNGFYYREAYRVKGGYLLSLGLEGNGGQGMAFTIVRA